MSAVAVASEPVAVPLVVSAGPSADTSDHPAYRPASQPAPPAAASEARAAAASQAPLEIVGSVLDRSEPVSRGTPQVAGTGPVRYRKPIEAPISDPFRPPSNPYGPGNRGVEFASTPGQTISAMADGLVTFAGQVGGSLHVVVLHADGLRTSYSYLVEVLVAMGQRVAAGAAVGRTAGRVHVGARRGEVYIDPARLWAPRRAARLVPDDLGRPLGRP